MAGFIELIAKIKPKNNGKYPLVDDVDVEMEDGSRLSEAIKKPRIPDGGTEGQILAKKSNTNGDAAWVEPLKTEDIDKKLESKLDKNLGSENSDKVLTTDSQGNIITQDKEEFEGSGGTTNYDDLENKPQINGVELNGNKTSGDLKMYTQEEVDDLLYDKMDKPYKPITITDDITIEDCLDGRFKINKILGNTYQAEESDIVPTPQRPIPINSRKTTITKVNPNIFDFEKENDTSNIPDSGTYRSIGQHQLKANTKYIFEWAEATVPAKATLSLQIQDDKGTVLVSPFTYFNLQADEKKEAGKQVKFTTNESGIIKFAYNCTVGTSSTTVTYQQYWYTKILKNISLKEDVEYESEYVELRSLKESKNLFDKNIMAFTSGTLNSDGTVRTSASYAVSGFVPVGPSTQYTIKVIDGFRSSTKVYYDINKQVISNEIIATFTTPSNCYFVRWQTATTDTRVLTEEDIQKINDEMMMVKGDSLPSSYVPPTVRDYKIVDHTTQTSKIVRNVGTKGFDGSEDEKWEVVDSLENTVRFRIELSTAKNNSEGMCSNNTWVTSGVSLDKSVIGVSNGQMYYRLPKTVLNSLDLEKFKMWLQQNPFTICYELLTRIEEPITYVKADTSEVGYSWQDTTSPSPTIKSEVKGVEKIDILKTGKNLFDVEKAKDPGLWDGITLYSYRHFTGICFEPNTTYTFSVSKNNMYKDYKTEYNGIFTLYIGETIDSASPNKLIGNTGANISYISNKYTFTTTEKPMYLNLYVNKWDVQFLNIVFNELLQNIQIEVGDTATAYEPYTEQHVNITLPQPLYENDVANVESGDYEYEMQKYIVTGNENFIKDYQNQSGYYGRYFILINANHNVDTSVNSVFCNALPYVKYSWDVNKEGFCQNINRQIHFKFSNDRLGITDNTSLEEKRLAFANYLKQLYASENPLYVVVKVAKTTQPIPEEDLAKLKSLKTEQGVTNIFVGGEVKPTIEARYPQDLALVQQQLEQKILLISDSLIDTQAKVLLQGGN